MLLPFADLLQWWSKRQKHLGWTNQTLADNSKVPVGTINRIKAGEYPDCKYSTIKSILIALIGGTTDEFACTEQVEKELQQMEKLERQAEQLSTVEKENKALKDQLSKIDEIHRNDIRVIRDEYNARMQEYREQVAFRREQLRAWRTVSEKKG
jgi:predicted transcriptional regulator